jgi:hypothetical protein
MMALAAPLKKMLIGRTFSTEKSRIKLFGEMDWTLEPSRGMAQLIQEPALEVERRFNEKGEDFLFKFGYENGKVITDELLKHLMDEDKKITQKTINGLLEFIGIGQLEFISVKTERDGHHHIIVQMLNNPITEHAKKMYKDKSMVCAFFRGMFTAHGEKYFEAKNFHLVEKKCMCKDPKIRHCEWESKW